MDITFTLRLPRDEVSVPIVRHLSREALTKLGVAPDCVADIELGVTEACTNVLKHAKSENEQYNVEVQVDGATCIVRVTDAGTGFDPGAARVASESLSAEGGRGIRLMEALADNIQFVSKPEDGTVVFLEKRLSLEEGAVLLRLQAGTLED